MATEPTPDTPSAAELVEALRALLDRIEGHPHVGKAVVCSDKLANAECVLARYDAAQKSPLDALLAWAPGPWVVADEYLCDAAGKALAFSASEVELEGYDPALMRFLTAAPQMLDALRKIAVYPDHRHSSPGDAFMAISNIAKIALQAAGDKP